MEIRCLATILLRRAKSWLPQLGFWFQKNWVGKRVRAVRLDP
jgi:hypothetical protein